MFDLIIPGGNVRTIRLFEAVLSLLVPYWLAATCADQSEAIIQISLSQLQTGTAISLTLNLVKL